MRIRDAMIAATCLLAGCGSGSSTSSTASSAGPARRIAAPARPAVVRPVARHRVHHAVRRHRRAPAPGTLPQTHALPSAAARVFQAQMRALWRGVRTGRPQDALPAFFPLAAYAQVKAIDDPQADWSGRLVPTYGLDIAAAHALLGAGAPHAKLVRVIVPQGFSHWVGPGACFNRVGYYEVPSSRVVYRAGGVVRSFGIASMISWRGVWYVVHLGSVSGPPGTVDDPSAGTGTPVPSSTC